MCSKVRKHEQHGEQGRVLDNAFQHVAFKKFHKGSLHSASGTLDTKVSLIKACALVTLEPADKIVPEDLMFHFTKIGKGGFWLLVTGYPYQQPVTSNQ